MKNMGASVRYRLAEMARAEKKDLVVLLDHYMIERLLYRLSKTEIGGLIALKGAMLFSVWYDAPTRTTRDADFLSMIHPSNPKLKECLIEAMSMDIDDGVEFRVSTLKECAIKKQNQLPGTHFNFFGYIAGARVRGQLDISFGDIVTERIKTIDFPVILKDMPTPAIPVYPLPSVVAEKIEAMCAFGLANSRLKDFFDISMILSNEKIDAEVIQRAIRGTFENRGTTIPDGSPAAFSHEFSDNNRAGWDAFIRKNKAQTTMTLDQTQALIAKFVMPIWKAMHANETFEGCWNPQRKQWGPKELAKEPLLVPLRRTATEVGFNM